jgi:hypothetical protein
MRYTLNIDCPGQRPTKLQYDDPQAARQAAWRIGRGRGAEKCHVEVRSPEGEVLRGARERGLRGNRAFRAIEMDVERGEPTGRVEYYTARDLPGAVQRVLYTKSFKHRGCTVGRSGRTVICGNLTYVVRSATG